MSEEDQHNEDFQSIGACLNDAGKYSLEVEVVYSALKYAQANPTKTVAECISSGFYEWVK